MYKHLSGGLLHFSEVMSPISAQSLQDTSEADLAVREALAIFELLQQTLKALRLYQPRRRAGSPVLVRNFTFFEHQPALS
jgi:hypothetical protein